MERRDFMKSLAGAGALVATSNLPVFAQDKPEVFPKRGQFERLAISYATVKIGLDKPFSILHISDTHLTAAYPYENEKKQKLNVSRTRTFGGRQEEALRDSLEWARRHVDYVVHTGDLIDWQSEANFDLVKKYFGEGMVGNLGNHEFSTDMGYSEPKETQDEGYKDNTRAKLQEVYPFNVRFCSQVVNGVNFVTLDDVYGYVVPDQVAAFKAEVAKGLPIVLCMHVPFYTEDIWRATKHFWDKQARKFSETPEPEITGSYLRQQEDAITRDFIKYLKQQPLLRAILCGHEHITVQDRFSKTATEFVVGSNFLFHAQEILFI